MLPSTSCPARILISISFSRHLRVNYGKPKLVRMDRLCTVVANEDMDKLGIGSSTVRLDRRYGQSAFYPCSSIDPLRLWMSRGNQTRPEEARVWAPRPTVLRPGR